MKLVVLAARLHPRLERIVKALFALALVACTRNTSTPPPDAEVQLLSNDVYFDQGTPPCGAPSPQDCTFELGFCTDASYRFLMGDVITAGTYQLENGNAVDETTGFTFDFTMQRIVVSDGIHEDTAPWQATTAVQDADVACAR
jgi:hypothetical protein